MTRVLLVPVGSHGDVHPFVGVGRRLQAMGHRVTLLTNGYFEPLAQAAGLEFRPLGDAAEFLKSIGDPKLWQPHAGFWHIVEHAILPAMPKVFDAVREWWDPAQGGVVVAGSLAFGARVAEEALGVPTVTVHLQPLPLHTIHDTPRFAGFLPTHRLPRFLRPLFFRLMDRVGDRALATPVNAFRAEQGLKAPAKRIVGDWMHARTRILGMFPDWFAPIQPDWPERLRLTGFPRYDEQDLAPLPADLADFLDAGEPPIAFTPGSAMRHNGPFFAAAVDACKRLGRRGLLLTRHAEQLPKSLPDGVLHVPFAPFSQLFPRVAAAVHHFGVGTCAQAMAAGVPQLAYSLGAFDQPDNIRRLVRLGVADSLPRAKFTGRRAAERLARLLGDPQVKAAAAAVARRFDGEDAIGAACTEILAVARSAKDGSPA